MPKNTRTYLLLFLALVCAAPVLAATDPTIAQVYDAARTGHLDQAQQMMGQVLRDHPQSAKAHYVAAELYARGGDAPLARQELDTAQKLEPGLPFVRPESVQELQKELTQPPSVQHRSRYSQARSQVPFGTVLLVLAGIGVLWMIMRRRNPPAGLYSQYPSAVPTGGAGAMNYGGPGVASNMGSGIAGSLASGLAVGAGVVAAEEIAHHFLDGNRGVGNVLPDGSEAPGVAENGDMGGSNFGVSDGSSWDDGSGSIGGGDIGGGDRS
jgi:uncharacterized protein